MSKLYIYIKKKPKAMKKKNPKFKIAVTSSGESRGWE